MGVSLGLAWVYRRSAAKIAAGRVEAGIWTLAAALLGGRMAFVALVWSYYSSHIVEIFQVYQGGLSWFGALGGGLLGMSLYARRRGQHLGKLADDLLPLLTALSTAAWAGTLAEGWGLQEIDLYLPQGDPVVAWQTVYRLTAYSFGGACASLGVFWLVERLPSTLDRSPGVRFSLALAGLNSIMGWLALRLGWFPRWGSWPLDFWAAMAFTALAMGGALLAWWPTAREHGWIWRRKGEIEERL